MRALGSAGLHLNAVPLTHTDGPSSRPLGHVLWDTRRRMGEGQGRRGGAGGGVSGVEGGRAVIPQ